VPIEVGGLDVKIDAFSLIASGIKGLHERRIGNTVIDTQIPHRQEQYSARR
jgi:hypothetical protein